MIRREMQDAITILKRDLAETMRELGDLRSRVWELEQARDADKHADGQRKVSRYPAGYPHGLGKGHE